MRRYSLALRLQGHHTFLLDYELLAEVAADDAITADRSSEIRGQPRPGSRNARRILLKPKKWYSSLIADLQTNCRATHKFC
jgi:hypothetical protein